MIEITNLSTLPSNKARTLLFERLFDRVCRLEPRIIVDGILAMSIKDFGEFVASGEALPSNGSTYSRLFHTLASVQLDRPGVLVRLSLRIVTLYGAIGDALPERGPRLLPLPLALMILATAESDVRQSVLWQSGSEEDELWITPQGTKSLGLCGKVRLGLKLRPQEATFETITGPSAFIPRIARCVEVLVRRGL